MSTSKHKYWVSVEALYNIMPVVEVTVQFSSLYLTYIFTYINICSLFCVYGYLKLYHRHNISLIKIVFVIFSDFHSYGETVLALAATILSVSLDLFLFTPVPCNDIKFISAELTLSHFRLPFTL